jgi:hypothetical protein
MVQPIFHSQWMCLRWHSQSCGDHMTWSGRARWSDSRLAVIEGTPEPCPHLDAGSWIAWNSDLPLASYYSELEGDIGREGGRERDRINAGMVLYMHAPFAVLGLLAKTRMNSLKSTVPSLFLTKEFHNALPSGPSHTTPNLQNCTSKSNSENL